MGNLSENNTSVILWREHGNVFKTPDGTLLSSCILPIKKNDYNNRYKDDKYSLADSDGRCVITTNFWYKYCDNVDGGLFFTISCNTGADGGYAAKIFLEKGFTTYAAPNEKIFTLYADKMMGRTVEYMCGKVDDNIYNFDEAIMKAKKDLGETDFYSIGAEIVHGNKTSDGPFYLVPRTEEQILKEHFKKLIEEYGIKVKAGSDERKESILSSENKVIPIMNYLVECTYSSYEFNLYKIEAKLIDHTKFRDEK